MQELNLVINIVRISLLLQCEFSLIILKEYEIQRKVSTFQL